MVNRLTPTYELYWYWNTIPEQYRPYICTCPNDGTRRFVNVKNQDWLSCSKCKKAYPTTLKECVVCDLLYIDDFKYPDRKLGYLHWKCWKCCGGPFGIENNVPGYVPGTLVKVRADDSFPKALVF